MYNWSQEDNVRERKLKTSGEGASGPPSKSQTVSMKGIEVEQGRLEEPLQPHHCPRGGKCHWWKVQGILPSNIYLTLSDDPSTLVFPVFDISWNFCRHIGVRAECQGLREAGMRPLPPPGMGYNSFPLLCGVRRSCSQQKLEAAGFL